MLNIIKKICIAVLFLGKILLPMDPPTKEQIEPISIITLLDKNIEYFHNVITAIDDKIIKAKSREYLKEQLKSDKLEPQQLLELNQSYKQQWQDNLNKQLLRHQQNLDQDKQALDKTRANLQATLTNLDPLVQQSKKLLDVTTPIDPSNTFTYPEVTPFPINVDQLVQNTENNIMHGVDTILHNQGNSIVTEMEKVSDSYRQEIEEFTKEIEQNKLLLATDEKKLEQKKKYALFTLCTGIPLLILCSIYMTKYFYPQ